MFTKLGRYAAFGLGDWPHTPLYAMKIRFRAMLSCDTCLVFFFPAPDPKESADKGALPHHAFGVVLFDICLFTYIQMSACCAYR